MEFLSALKPDGVLRRAAGANVLQGLISSGLCEIKSFQKIKLPKTLINEHYSHVINRPFYPWLANYMCGSASYVIILEGGADALPTLRNILGATRAHSADKETLRYKHAPYGGANCLHLSEDSDAARYEVDLWKRVLDLQEGQFDTSPEKYIEHYNSSPEMTLELREILSEIAAEGEPVSSSKIEQVSSFLEQECIDANKDQIQYLTDVLVQGSIV
jgi:nucleoside-diphosphate kinase